MTSSGRVMTSSSRGIIHLIASYHLLLLMLFVPVINESPRGDSLCHNDVIMT